MNEKKPSRQKHVEKDGVPLFFCSVLFGPAGYFALNGVPLSAIFSV